MDNMLPPSILNALTRRNVDPSTMFQAVTNPQPGIVPPPPSPMPNMSPMSAMGQSQPTPQQPMQPQMPPPTQAPQATTPPKFTPQNEGELIVQTLVKRLEALNKATQTPGRSDQQELKAFNQGAGNLANTFMQSIAPQ